MADSWSLISQGNEKIARPGVRASEEQHRIGRSSENEASSACVVFWAGQNEGFNRLLGGS